MNIHEKYIKRCIALAKNGSGLTYPNPMVGCVIVLHGKIIGEGWHKRAGLPHAEVNAINSVKNKQALAKATLYVSLEPCAHFGKTPPCSNLIIESGIRKVVIGTVDKNNLVAGKGIEHLKKNNCEVIVGVLERECYELNKRFFTFHTKKRPFIILKWAETQDGFIDKIRVDKGAVEPNWISNEFSKQLVHKMRATEQSILVGTNTALIDNPSLTTRNWFGENPVRLIIDKELRIPESYNVYKNNIKSILFTFETKKDSDFVKFENIDFSQSIPYQICNFLYENEIQSVLIEGGKITLQSFIDENLWDEAFVFKSMKSFGEGLKAPNINKAPVETQTISTDTLSYFKNY